MLVNKKSFLKLVRSIYLVSLICLGFMTILATGGGGDGSTGTNGDTNGETTDSVYDLYSPLPAGTSFEYEDDDLTPTIITFGSITITGGNGARYEGNTVYIESPGTYNISGTIADGQIKVDTLEDGDVRLVLQGVDITCLTGPPIDIENAERVIVRLEPGTDNYLTDGASYTSLDENLEPDATLFSKEDLVICGEGSLNVDANYNNGIKSKDGLIIDSGTIYITSVDDGIIGKNYISIEGGDITVDAEGDGLKSTNEPAYVGEVTGYIVVADGYIDISAGADAIQVETHIVIDGGEFDLYTAGGSSNTTFNKDLYTAKGLKAPVGITIYDGIFTIDSADDAIHSNDTIIVNGGDYSLYSGDDAIHADLVATVNAGVINVSTCYEGIESMNITINDGEIHVQSQDDPINATDGNRGENTPGVSIYVNGGYSYFECVNADGFDSNGAIVMTGGTVIVNGPITGANGILDYGTFTMDGGMIIGAGTSNMAQAPGGGTSTQNALLLIFKQQYTDTLFHLETSNGEEVVTFLPAKAYQSIVFSSSALELDTTYNVYMGGTITGTAPDGLGGTYNNDGTLYTSFTIEDAVTQIGSGGGMPGGGQPGG